MRRDFFLDEKVPKHESGQGYVRVVEHSVLWKEKRPPCMRCSVNERGMEIAILCRACTLCLSLARSLSWNLCYGLSISVCKHLRTTGAYMSRTPIINISGINSMCDYILCFITHKLVHVSREIFTPDNFICL